MQYIDAISTMSCALNGTSMCVAAKRELWAKPIEGDAFAVHSVMDEGGADCVFYIIYVTDYLGNRYPFEKLTRESQEALLDWVIDERFLMDEGEVAIEVEWDGDDYVLITPQERAMSEEQRKYAACLYGYTLEPLSWQKGYKWSDYVADSDFSLRMGIEDEHGPIVSERVARMWYESYRENIERYGLEEFYLSNFGYLYRGDDDDVMN